MGLPVQTSEVLGLVQSQDIHTGMLVQSPQVFRAPQSTWYRWFSPQRNGPHELAGSVGARSGTTVATSLVDRCAGP